MKNISQNIAEKEIKHFVCGTGVDKDSPEEISPGKRVNISETKVIFGNNIPQNITKMEEIAVNAQELATAQKRT